MRPSSVTQTGVGTSAAIPVDIYSPSPAKGVYLSLVGGAATVTVQITPDDIWDPAVTPVWTNTTVTTLVGASASANGQIDLPCRAIRMNQTAGTGSMKMTVIQQGLM